MNELIDIKTCEILLSDALSFYLTLCGIQISVLTLLYSFIMSKRSELELYAELSKKGNKDPLLNKRCQLAVSYIKRLKSIVLWTFIILCISILTCIISWATLRFASHKLYFGSFFIVCVSTLLICAGTMGQVKKVIYQYRQDTKI